MDINNSEAIKELVLLCQNEKPFGTRAFEKLTIAFQPSIYRFCFNYIKNENEAEDITQNIFLKVFHNITKFKHESTFKTWIYRISINVCTDFYNKKKRQMQIKQEIEAHRQTGSSVTETEKIIEDKDQVYKSLEKLSSQEREVLILRFYEGLKIQEIADTLDIQLSAAKMRLSRALEHFKIVHQTKGPINN